MSKLNSINNNNQAVIIIGQKHDNNIPGYLEGTKARYCARMYNIVPSTTITYFNIFFHFFPVRNTCKNLF